nr:NnrS family protein [uncultured Rhodopila sp.]
MPDISHPATGQTIFGDGSRPSLITGAVWAGLVSLILVPGFFAALDTQTAFSPAALQVHETLFAYLGAVIAGFVLTSIPEWTGRPPLHARALTVLIVAWLAGRAAVAASGFVGPLVAGGVDCLFLALTAITAATEAAKGRGGKALPPIGLLIVFLAGNAVFYLGSYGSGSGEAGKRIGIAAAVILVTLIGGRTAFGRNAPDAQTAEPAPFGALGVATVAVSGLALLAWIILPDYRASAALMLLAGIVQAVRLARWVFDRSPQTTLTLVQQLAYAFIPLGFLVIGGGVLFGHDQSGGVDVRAWMVSATGILTLAMMARISPDAAARSPSARTMARVIYAAIAVVAVTRLFGGLTWILPVIGGAALMLLFAVFVIGYLPVLARPGKNLAAV